MKTQPLTNFGIIFIPSICLFAFFLSACQIRNASPPANPHKAPPVGQKPTPPDPPVQPGEPDPPAEPELKIDIYQGPEANEYHPVLSWDSEKAIPTWYILRGDKDNKPIEYALLKGNVFSFEDKKTEPGKGYEYVLGYEEDGNFVLADRKKVLLPKDFLVNESVSGSSAKLKGIKRLFFTSNGVLNLNGSSLNTNVDEIISDGGVIRGCDGILWGSYSSSIQLRSRSGTGKLKVEAFGCRGRRGYIDPSGLNTHDPSPGQDSPLVFVSVANADDFSVNVERRAGKGGGWINNPAGKPAADGKLQPYCVLLDDQKFGECDQVSEESLNSVL